MYIFLLGTWHTNYFQYMPTKVHLVKAMVFPAIMDECESWSIKKAECQRIDAFELWCWRRFLRVLWTAGRSNQSILKEISPEYSLEGLMLRLKFQYSGHLMWRTDPMEKKKNPDSGKDWRLEEKGMTENKMVGWHHQLDGHESEQAPEVGDGQGSLVCCSPWGHKESDMAEWLNWTIGVSLCILNTNTRQLYVLEKSPTFLYFILSFV